MIGLFLCISGYVLKVIVDPEFCVHLNTQIVLVHEHTVSCVSLAYYATACSSRAW